MQIIVQVIPCRDNGWGCILKNIWIYLLITTANNRKHQKMITWTLLDLWGLEFDWPCSTLSRGPAHPYLCLSLSLSRARTAAAVQTRAAQSQNCFRVDFERKLQTSGNESLSAACLSELLGCWPLVFAADLKFRGCYHWEALGLGNKIQHLLLHLSFLRHGQPLWRTAKWASWNTAGQQPGEWNKELKRCWKKRSRGKS